MENRDNKLALLEGLPNETVWTTRRILEYLNLVTTDATLKATERAIQASPIRFEPLADEALVDEHGRSAKRLVVDQLIDTARKKRKLILFAQSLPIENKIEFLALNDARGGRRWIRLDKKKDSIHALQEVLTRLCDFEQKHVVIIPSGSVVVSMRELVRANRGQLLSNQKDRSISISLEVYSHGHGEILKTENSSHKPTLQSGMTHLDRLEAESIHIMREVMAEADNPVMLY